MAPGPAPVAQKPGWVIQIGATPEVGQANDLLTRAKSKTRAVASAQAVTEKVQKGSTTLYRARFAGLAESAAQSACSDLKRSGFACIAMKN
jgi:D-alanyl-D-alanine carboxypeptidase